MPAVAGGGGLAAWRQCGGRASAARSWRAARLHSRRSRAALRKYGVTTGATISVGIPKGCPGASASASGTASGTASPITTRQASTSPARQRCLASSIRVTVVTPPIAMRRKRAASRSPPWQRGRSATTMMCEQPIDHHAASPLRHHARPDRSEYPRGHPNVGQPTYPYSFRIFSNIHGLSESPNYETTDSRTTD